MVTEVHPSKLTYGDLSASYASIGYSLAVFCLILPVRSILHHITPEVEEEENTAYKKVALTFPSDYDKENPLTINSGQKRILELQLEEAKASGNTELV